MKMSFEGSTYFTRSTPAKWAPAIRPSATYLDGAKMGRYQHNASLRLSHGMKPDVRGCRRSGDTVAATLISTIRGRRHYGIILAIDRPAPCHAAERQYLR